MLGYKFYLFSIIKCYFPIWEDEKDCIAIVFKTEVQYLFSKRFLTSKFIFNIGWGFVSKQEKHGYGWPWLMVVVEELGFTGIYYTILAC